MSVRIQSVRVRTTIGASAVVLVALVAAGVALTATVRRSQFDAIDNALELRAINIESLLDGGASAAAVGVQSDDDGVVQIIDDSGAIVASSENIAGEQRLVSNDVEATSTHELATVDNEAFRIHVHPTDGQRRFTIIVGSTLEDLHRIERVLFGALVIGIPLLLVVIASMVWIVVGRALRPVEAIRTQVASIGGADLDRRVPVPAARDEIGRLALTMNEMLDRLEDSSVRQSRFVSDASHELRTPIAVIRHELEVALATSDIASVETWRETATDVLDEDLRMQRLVDDLLYMARRDEHASNHRAFTNAPLIDLDDLVLDEIRRQPTNTPIDVSGLSAGQVRGNRDHMSRVVRNLLDNALRHATSRVAVRIVSNAGTVALTVDDDGPGVPWEHTERVFERFGRADDARTRDDGGSGLGLAIVRDIVSDHGGTVTVTTSTRLGGASFAVDLPDARQSGP